MRTFTFITIISDRGSRHYAIHIPVSIQSRFPYAGNASLRPGMVYAVFNEDIENDISTITLTGK